ncbi:hypothetical protein DFH28DRAFT_982736 [Melampsora americana]|nr:hypothetical protein DFH28DRAFT_982736 [Melampsora americana]
MKFHIIFIIMIFLSLDQASGRPLQHLPPDYLPITHGFTSPTFTEPSSVIYPRTYQRYMEISKDMEQLHQQAHKAFEIGPTKDIIAANSEFLDKNIFCSNKQGKGRLYSLLCDSFVFLQECIVLEAFMFLGLEYFGMH